MHARAHLCTHACMQAWTAGPSDGQLSKLVQLHLCQGQLIVVARGLCMLVPAENVHKPPGLRVEVVVVVLHAVVAVDHLAELGEPLAGGEGFRERLGLGLAILVVLNFAHLAQLLPKLVAFALRHREVELAVVYRPNKVVSPDRVEELCVEDLHVPDCHRQVAATLRRLDFDLPAADLGRQVPPAIDLAGCLLEARRLAAPPGLQQLQLIADPQVALLRLLCLLGVELPLPRGAAVVRRRVLAALGHHLLGLLNPLPPLAGGHGRQRRGGRRGRRRIRCCEEGIDLANVPLRERCTVGLARRLRRLCHLLQSTLLLLDQASCLLRRQHLLQGLRPALGDVLLGLMPVLLLQRVVVLLRLLGRRLALLLLLAHLLEERVHHGHLVLGKAHVVVWQGSQRWLRFVLRLLRPLLAVPSKSLEGLSAVDILCSKRLRNLREIPLFRLLSEGLLQLCACRLGLPGKVLADLLFHELLHFDHQLPGLLVAGMGLQAPSHEVLRQL
mmetsp:Transcript_154/g.586  ORF Transcript_154/g.586 Transcript_154/m.586 type:complete len:499 (+) Transcript_154:261-1757(+)